MSQNILLNTFWTNCVRFSCCCQMLNDKENYSSLSMEGIIHWVSIYTCYMQRINQKSLEGCRAALLKLVAFFLFSVGPTGSTVLELRVLSSF